MNTQQLHATQDKETGLTIFNNKDGHSDPYWKGVVVDDVSKQVVARSFQGSNTVISEGEVPADMLYSPLYESTVLRFYRHNGEPMISTHRQVNISHLPSRVPIPNGPTFMSLINKAIDAWEKKDVVVFNHNGAPAITSTPTSWEDLCIEGWCNVFLLVDQSNQKTNLVDLTQHGGPLLLYALSLSTETLEMKPYSAMPVFPTSLLVDRVDTHYEYFTLSVPTVPVLDSVAAGEHVRNGGAVVGYHSDSKDQGTKYFSPIYNRKIRLANETTNPIHRWHELMDESEEVAREYLAGLPSFYKHMDHDFMKKTAEAYVTESATFITEVVVARFLNKDYPLSEMVAKRVSPIAKVVVPAMKRKYGRHKKNKDGVFLAKQAELLVREGLMQMTYTQRHTIRGRIAKRDREM
jgi:hypothetical protein